MVNTPQQMISNTITIDKHGIAQVLVDENQTTNNHVQYDILHFN